ncbi:uncharacterized protein Eint_040345 [Encephalitozoon intestinalis ATCC 50506]|uniref:Uncharacterized protein n=1 Tax=Encephalitozoon intestinalis (strain ATCC 50506) TaxID=876142 RepID=W8P971_ENCIT|nr:uncharacterized protein Eint_040345 [Encephalitozoon intestinalis ATCC 50506]AHL30087.1 hypothetical protein Eint_040345 [Encephalitozoon intestinalis ATCC 50506]UTX45012.1 hypothetical protein GPK93_04g05470 [Encephalitozoon intestinalis]
MGIERRRFYQKLTVFIVLMFVSPIAVHVIGKWFESNPPAISFISLFLVLGSMGAICKLVIDREQEKRNRRERKIKVK